MGSTVRLRFVALDVVHPWIELQRTGLWKLRHPDRRGYLSISMFPVAEGVTMDLETLQALCRERQRDSVFDRLFVPLDDDSWAERAVFCVASSSRTRTGRGIRHPFPWPASQQPTYRRSWSLSDGRHVVEASLYEPDEANFRADVDDCDAMMRSVRFEGPS